MSKHTNNQTRSALQDAFLILRKNYIAVAVFSFFINILLFVGPLYMLQVYDRVLTSRSEVTLALISVLAVGMLVVYGLLENVRSRILVRTGARLDDMLAERLFRNSFRNHVRAPQGHHGQALRDLDTVRDSMSGGAIISFFDAPWVPVFLVICFLLHPYLGLVALTGAVIIFGLALANEFMTRKTLNHASNATRHANNYVASSLRNAETVHALGMSPGIMARWKHLHLEALRYQGAASDRAGTILAMSKFTRMALQVAVLGVGAWLVLEVQITPGVMIATSIMMGRALAPVESAVGQWKSIVAARSAYERLREAFASGPAQTENMQLPVPLGAVKLEQIVVVPPGSRLPTLRGVNLEIAAGEVVGVVGPSGSGKSTLARALVGIWPAASGQVRIDGSDIQTWDPDDLGPYVGYLPQDVELFAGSVADNIARFGSIDPAAVVEAARFAGVHEVILKLPDGYDTLIGESGRALSGGQRQRIALARALYGDARLIVLDEPNASLDGEGERALSEAIVNAKKGGRTVVVISHRTALLSVVDKLAVFSGGTLTLFGPRDAVLNQLNKSPNTLAQPRGQVTPLKLS